VQAHPDLPSPAASKRRVVDDCAQYTMSLFG
jgi:hypothetical protein